MKFKKDGTPKMSGGKRAGAGKPVTKTPPEHLPPWEKQLERALKTATRNSYFLPPSKFFTKRQIRDLYGNLALSEFNEYFRSVRRFDADKAEKIRQRQAEGQYEKPPATWPEKNLPFYTPEKYAEWLIKTKCFGWVAEVKSEHQGALWRRFNDTI